MIGFYDDYLKVTKQQAYTAFSGKLRITAETVDVTADAPLLATTDFPPLRRRRLRRPSRSRRPYPAAGGGRGGADGPGDRHARRHALRTGVQSP